MAKSYIDPATGQRVYVDAAGNVTPLPPAASYMEDDPGADPFGDYSAADIQQLQKQGAERAAVVGGVAALGDVARLAATALPTAADTENERRLAELAKHKGLSEAERADIDEQAMRGVRAFARETNARMGDQLAASGQHSAADLQRARASSQDALNRASIQAADIGIRENRAQVAADKQEEQERIAQKAKRDNEGRTVAIQALGSLMTSLAPAVAAQAVPTKPTESQFRKMQAMRTADGNAPLYPGLQALDYDMFTALGAQKMRDAMKSTPDSAARLPAS